MDYFLCETNVVNEYELVNVKGENILGEKIQEARHLNSNYISYKNMNGISHIYNLKTKKIIKTFDKNISILKYYGVKNTALMYKNNKDIYTHILYNYIADKYSNEYKHICTISNDRYSSFIDKNHNTGLILNENFEEILKGKNTYSISKFNNCDLDIIVENGDDESTTIYTIDLENQVKKLYSTKNYLNLIFSDGKIIILSEDDDYFVIDMEGNILIQKGLFSDIRYIENNKLCVKSKHEKKEYFFIELKIINSDICDIIVISDQYKHITPLSYSFNCNEDKKTNNIYFHVSNKNELMSMTNGIIDKNGDPITDLKYLNVWFFTSEEKED